MVEAMTNTGFPAVPAPEFADPLPGYSYVGEQCIAASYRIPDELKRRVNGAVRYAGDTGKIPGVESQTDLIRVAAHCYVAQLEQQFNNGQTFPDPGTNNHRGTRSRSPRSMGQDRSPTSTVTAPTNHGGRTLRRRHRLGTRSHQREPTHHRST